MITCGWCDMNITALKKYACNKCQLAVYCGDECAKSDWNGHSSYCGQVGNYPKCNPWATIADVLREYKGYFSGFLALAEKAGLWPMMFQSPLRDGQQITLFLPKNEFLVELEGKLDRAALTNAINHHIHIGELAMDIPRMREIREGRIEMLDGRHLHFKAVMNGEEPAILLNQIEAETLGVEYVCANGTIVLISGVLGACQ
jgi:hypothetical protein